MGLRGPTVRHRRLAAELRRFRDAAGYTCEEVGEHLDCSGSKISRVETGSLRARPRDVRDMLDLYGVTGERRDKLIQLARESAQRAGWWHVYEDVVPEWFSVYVELEAEVRSLRTFEGLLVPGLLQTERYARAIIDAAEPSAAEADIDRWAALRIRRQESLGGDRPLQLWAILDEAVLRRPVGGAEVMREQLDHIAEVAGWPNVTVQVVPLGMGAHPGMEGPFVVMEFPDPDDHDVVYLENRSSGLFVEEPEQVRRHCQTFEHLRAGALSPSESTTLIRRLADDRA